MENIKENKTCTFHVEGMHCAACELTIEKKLGKAKGVTFVDAKLNQGIVEVKGNFDESEEELAQQFTELVKDNGYTITIEKSFNKKEINWTEYFYAIPIALTLILLFIILQRFIPLDLVNLEGNNLNLPAAFIIGLVASISSCAAVVGGLALSLSSTFSSAGKRIGTASSISFHLGRLLSFFILGGVIGWVGSLFTLDGDSARYWTIGASLFTGIVLLVLAIGLITSNEFFQKFTPKLPKSISHKLLNLHDVNVDPSSKRMPILAIAISTLAGIITFFLPCGFTQSMQLYSLGTGGFLNGALTMLTFALGTLPALALISFASVKLSSDSKVSSIFLKTAGFLVLFFAIVNLSGALVVLGLIDPLFGF